MCADAATRLGAADVSGARREVSAAWTWPQAYSGSVGQGCVETWQRFDETSLDDLREQGESRTAFLLRFTLSHPQLHTTIVATKNPDHLKENVQATLAGPLPADVYGEAKRRLASAGLSPAVAS